MTNKILLAVVALVAVSVGLLGGLAGAQNHPKHTLSLIHI